MNKKKTHRIRTRNPRGASTRMVAALLGAVLFAAAAFAADEPWKSKPFQQWTEKDIHRVLTGSPWVRSIVVSSGSVPGGFGGSSGLGSSGPETPPANGQLNPNQPPEPEQEEQQAPTSNTQTFYVFWQSSKTMRAAVAQRAVLQSKLTEAEAEKYVNEPQADYLIVVQGQNMRVFQTYDEKFAQESTFLRLKKSKEKVSPSRVEFQKAPDGNTITAVIFHFAKKLPSGSPLILPDEKSIEFTCKLGAFLLDTSFDPQKMKDQSGPDL